MADLKNSIETKFSVDTKDAKKDVDKLVGSVDNLNESLQDTEKETKKIPEATKKASKGFELLDGATGGLLSKFKALIASPVGLAIAALGVAFTAIKKAISGSSKASETFGKISEKISGIIDTLISVITPLVELVGEGLLKALENPIGSIKGFGESITKFVTFPIRSLLKLGDSLVALFKGDFKEAARLAKEPFVEIKDAVDGVVDSVVDYSKEVSENIKKTTKAKEDAARATELLKRAEESLVRNRILLQKERLKSQTLEEKERQIRDNTSLSIKERIKANERLGKIIEEQSQKELKIAKQNLNLANLKLKDDSGNLSIIKEKGDAEIKILEIQDRISRRRSEQLRNENLLRKARGN